MSRSQAVVEGVPADVARRLHRAADRELPGLAGQRRRQQAALDPGRQRERLAPLAPLEQVGEARVDDHHVAQRVRGRGDVADRGGVRLRRQEHLQHADHVAPLGDRGEHPGPPVVPVDLDLLRPHHLLVRGPGQRHRLGRVGSPRPRRSVAPVVTEPDQGGAVEGEDEEGDLLGGQPVTQLGREHVHGRDRRRRLHGGEDRPEIQTSLTVVRHPRILGSPAHRPARRRPGVPRRCRPGSVPAGPANAGGRISTASRRTVRSSGCPGRPGSPRRSGSVAAGPRSRRRPGPR